MDEIDLYTKSAEWLMMKFKISVTDASYLKEGKQWWKAWQTGSVNGDGETPHEAIIDYYKKKLR